MLTISKSKWVDVHNNFILHETMAGWLAAWLAFVFATTMLHDYLLFLAAKKRKENATSCRIGAEDGETTWSSRCNVNICIMFFLPHFNVDFVVGKNKFHLTKRPTLIYRPYLNNGNGHGHGKSNDNVIRISVSESISESWWLSAGSEWHWIAVAKACAQSNDRAHACQYRIIVSKIVHACCLLVSWAVYFLLLPSIYTQYNNMRPQICSFAACSVRVFFSVYSSSADQTALFIVRHALD